MKRFGHRFQDPGGGVVHVVRFRPGRKDPGLGVRREPLGYGLPGNRFRLFWKVQIETAVDEDPARIIEMIRQFCS